MSSRPIFHVTVESLEDACMIRAVGEIDMGTVDRLRSALDGARADCVTALVDLSEVSFIDSTGLHVLLEAALSAADSDWELFLVRPSARVRRLVEVTGTGPLLPIVADRDDAELVHRKTAPPQVA
jgi:anti-sigma B factor antagonist